MKFNMSNLNPPAWFLFNEDDPEEGRILLRVCAGRDLERIEKETNTKQPPEYRRGQRFIIPDKVDEKKRSRMIWDFVIVDWEGVLDEAEKPIKCTTDNKVQLMEQSVVFAGFVGECLEKMNADIKGYQENLEKNLSSSQKGLEKSLPVKIA